MRLPAVALGSFFAVFIIVLGTPTEAADLYVPSDGFPTLQSAVTEAAGNGEVLNTIWLVDRVSTTASITIGDDFGSDRALVIRPVETLGRGTIESLNGSQTVFFFDNCYNVTFQDLDILRNTTNANDLILMNFATNCLIGYRKLQKVRP